MITMQKEARCISKGPDIVSSTICLYLQGRRATKRKSQLVERKKTQQTIIVLLCHNVKEKGLHNVWHKKVKKTIGLAISEEIIALK